MRQVNIRTLRANLSAELKNLPFEIIKSGSVVGVCTQKRQTSKNIIKKQPANIITKKQSVDRPKADLFTGEVFFNPHPKNS